MKVLVVGSGGREHAICWKLKQSPKVTELYCAPGNGGISALAQCVDVKATDVDGMVRWAVENHMDFVMVAPDDPLALGMVDALEAAGIPAFGPRKNAAVIEASKIFSKNLMEKYHIPTASYRTFSDMNEALSYVREQGAPIVVKADGLALGKGVIVAQTVEEAEAAVRSMMEDKKFGESGVKVVIERTKPEVLAIEKLFYQHNQTTVIGVAEARGVILLAAAQAGLPIYEYTPMQVKQAVTGYGKAVKKQVQEMTRMLLNLPAVPKPDDTADALAMAITFCHTNGNQLNRFTRRVAGPI